MKKVIKVLFTILFLFKSILLINELIIDFSNNGLIFIVVAVTFYVSYLFALVAPKSFFNLCWKITTLMEDSFDYDKGLKMLESVSVGLLILANVILTLGFLII